MSKPRRARAEPATTLSLDEKELLESFERGEWKPASADEVARMRELARNRLRQGRRRVSASFARSATLRPGQERAK